MRAARRVISGLAWLGLGIAAVDLIARPVARLNLIGQPGLEQLGPALTLGALASIVLLLLSRGPRLRTFTIFAVLFVAGLYGQVRVGVRLRGDGFYYFAIARSMLFDRDMNLANDYRLIGFGDRPWLFGPTKTGYAHSAWAIGTPLLWSPFLGAAHLVARPLSEHRPNVTPDGSSFPYRQAAAVAGLFYGLVAAYLTWRLCLHFAARRIAIAATSLAIAGSFMVWYMVRDPTMTHAPAMASIAAFAWLWVATLGTRTTWQWIALGALGGLMADVRWQNAIYGLLPITEVATIVWRSIRAGNRRAIGQLLIDGGAGAAAFLVAFLPQMLMWKAIYGSFLAVSPLGPAIRFTDPHWADELWSSRNGLIAMSPMLGAGGLGLLLLIRRHRLIGVAFALSFVAMVLFNSMIQDWWGSSAFAARRFDGAVPLLAVGLALVIDAGSRLIATRPLIPAGLLLAWAVAWNGSFASILRRGEFHAGAQNDFGAISGAQWRSVHTRFGHPFSWPANLIYAWRNDVAPGRYDLLKPSAFFDDPVAPLGQIDFGWRDGLFLGHGLLPAATDSSETTYRPAARVSEILYPIGRMAPFTMQIRLRAAPAGNAPPQRVTVTINGTNVGNFPVTNEWDTIAFGVPPDVMRVALNRIVLTAAHGSDLQFARDGTIDPAFQPSLLIDKLRVDRADRQ